MLTIRPESNETLLVLEISGKLSKDHFERLEPELHRRREKSGDSTLVMIMDDFDGYDSLGALWTDLKMDMVHKDDFQKIAMVGDSRWESGFSKLADLISEADVRWFKKDNADEAMAWATA